MHARKKKVVSWTVVVDVVVEVGRVRVSVDVDVVVCVIVPVVVGRVRVSLSVVVSVSERHLHHLFVRTEKSYHRQIDGGRIPPMRTKK